MNLIAVKSCCRDWELGYHQIILDTWGRNLPPDTDLIFFVGNDGSPIQLKDWTLNEAYIEAPDDYLNLPTKVKCITEWSFYSGYDFTFLCDTDTFIIPDRLFKCGFEKFDYSGRFGAMPKIGTTFNYRDKYGVYPNCHPWASGGVGYFLSRKACETVYQVKPEVWAEDMHVGQVLGPHIQSGDIKASDLPIECDSAWHFPRRQYGNQSYDPKYGWMEKMYADHH